MVGQFAPSIVFVINQTKAFDKNGQSQNRNWDNLIICRKTFKRNSLIKIIWQFHRQICIKAHLHKKLFFTRDLNIKSVSKPAQKITCKWIQMKIKLNIIKKNVSLIYYRIKLFFVSFLLRKIASFAFAFLQTISKDFKKKIQTFSGFESDFYSQHKGLYIVHTFLCN